MKHVPTLIAVGIALLLNACTSDQQARGVTSETTNGGKLEGHILGVDGSPLGKVKITALREDPSLADTTQSILGVDSSASDGHWSITYADTSWHGSIILVAESGSNASMQRVLGTHPDTLQLAPREHLDAQTQWISSDSVSGPLQVSVLGLGSVTKMNSQGIFNFANLPHGNWTIRVRNLANQQLVGMASIPTAAQPSANPPLIGLSPTPFILFDNFDNQTDASLLQSVLSDSYWGSWHDSIATRPSVGYYPVPSYNTTDSAWQGASIHLTLTPIGDSTRSAGLSVSVGAGDRTIEACFHDMRNLDSVRFMIKGSGTVQFGFFARSMKDSLTNGVFASTINLPSQWTPMTIATTSLPFVPEIWSDSGSMTWSTARILGMQWKAMKPATIWLDNIVLYGLWPTDLTHCETWK